MQRTRRLPTPRGQATILLAGADAQLGRLATSLDEEGFDVRLLPTLRDLAATLPACAAQAVVVLDADDLAFARPAFELAHQAPPSPTLLLQGRESFLTAGGALLSTSGFDELAFKPLRDHRALQRLKALLVRAGFSLPGPPTDETLALATTRLLASRAIVVFGPKGGVGKTTVAVNLAAALSSQYELRVVLIDADLWFGDVSVMLNLSSNRSVYDLPNTFDLASLRQVLVPHNTGLLALLSPPDPTMVERLPEGIVPRVVQTARSVFDYVVVDTHPSFDETNLQLLEQADLVLTVTTPELSAIRNTSHFLRLSRTLGLDNKTHLILNRADSGLQIDSLEQSLNNHIAARVLSDGPAVVRAANNGVPVVQHDARAEQQVTRDLLHVAELVAGTAREEPSPARQNKLLAWMRR